MAETPPPLTSWTPSQDTEQSLLARVRRPDYHQWLGHIRAAAGCTNPIRLAGTIQNMVIDSSTGQIQAETTRSTEDMPDGVVYKACGNRRTSVCPSCAEMYRQDAYQLVLAGLRGGKTVPETVREHPAVFATLTAPGFGPVHTTRTNGPCRVRRTPDLCPHGNDRRCYQHHNPDDYRLGTPLCPDCYDYHHHAVWNTYSSELWRRTTITAHRLLRTWARDHGHLEPGGKLPVRISFGKVAEFQKRGLVHFHILARFDTITDDGQITPPPEWANTFLLVWTLRQAIETTTFHTPPLRIADPYTNHLTLNQPDGWEMAWGTQLDIRPIIQRTADPVTDDAVTAHLQDNGKRRLLSGTAVAGYLAKYATKATEDTGHTSGRITPDTIDIYATNTHPGRIIHACWQLGTHPAGEYTEQWQHTRYARMRRWAHMLGYGGHFHTKSRRYTTTFKALRQTRIDHQRKLKEQHTNQDQQETVSATTVQILDLQYVGRGWLTTADAILANTSAELARERQLIGRGELTTAL